MLSFGRTPARARSSLRSPLALVLLATVGVSLWLGWQAFAAQRHHREAVSSTLRRYTGMAAWEMSRLTQEGLDWYLHEVFDDVDRSRSEADEESIPRAMASAARRHDCECRLLREPIASFRIDFDEARLTLMPDTFDAVARTQLVARVTAQQHIEGAFNFPVDELSVRRDEFPEQRDHPIVTVCTRGNLSIQGMLALQSLGYRNVRSLNGGTVAWAEEGLPTQIQDPTQE